MSLSRPQPLRPHPLLHALALWLGATTAAWAADQPAAAAGEALPAITVTGRSERAATEGRDSYTTRATHTATGLRLSPRETPQSISVVTRTQIDDFALRDVRDLLSAASGVRVERVETDRTYFSARGFDIRNFQVDGLGLPFATGDQLGDIDTALYDRVEVVKGANGLSSSTGNPSATVNFVRKRPTPGFQASAGLTLGSWQQRRLDADVGGALNATHSLRARVIAAVEDRDSYLDRYHLRKTVLGTVLEADLGPDTVLTGGLSQQRNRPEGVMWGGLPLHRSDGSLTNYPRSASSAPGWTYWHTDDTQAFLELDHGWGGGWRSRATVLHRELASDAELFYVAGTLNPDGSGLSTYPSAYRHRERQWVADVNLGGPFTLAGRAHEARVGLSWSRSVNALRSSYAGVGESLSEEAMLDGSTPRPGFDKERVDGRADFADYRRTLYGVVRFNLSDDLKLITGANLTQARSDGIQYGEIHRYRKLKTTPYLGALYDLDAHHTVYASYTRIYHPQFKIDVANRVLDPLDGRSVEAGLKGEWFDGRLRGSLAVFRVTQKNDPVYAGFGANGSYYEGVDATSTGVELDLAGRIGRHWELTGSYTQLRLEDDEGEEARTFVPRRMFRLAASYRVPALPGLKLGAAVNWQSRSYRDEALAGGGTARVLQDGYALVDLMARYEISKHLSAGLNLRNVTNERYISSLYWSQNYAGAPRHVSASLNWTY